MSDIVRYFQLLLDILRYCQTLSDIVRYDQILSDIVKINIDVLIYNFYNVWFDVDMVRNKLMLLNLVSFKDTVSCS